jgi:hypothetical protein
MGSKASRSGDKEGLKANRMDTYKSIRALDFPKRSGHPPRGWCYKVQNGGVDRKMPRVEKRRYDKQFRREAVLSWPGIRSARSNPTCTFCGGSTRHTCTSLKTRKLFSVWAGNSISSVMYPSRRSLSRIRACILMCCRGEAAKADTG